MPWSSFNLRLAPCAWILDLGFSQHSYLSSLWQPNTAVFLCGCCVREFSASFLQVAKLEWYCYRVFSSEWFPVSYPKVEVVCFFFDSFFLLLWILTCALGDDRTCCQLFSPIPNSLKLFLLQETDLSKNPGICAFLQCLPIMSCKPTLLLGLSLCPTLPPITSSNICEMALPVNVNSFCVCNSQQFYILMIALTQSFTQFLFLACMADNISFSMLC